MVSIPVAIAEQADGPPSAAVVGILGLTTPRPAADPEGDWPDDNHQHDHHTDGRREREQVVAHGGNLARFGALGQAGRQIGETKFSPPPGGAGARPLTGPKV